MRKKFSLQIHLFLAALAVQMAQADEPNARASYVRSRQIVLAIHTDQPSPTRRVHVWASSDERCTWRPLPVSASSANAVTVTVESDGRFEFYVVVENDAGPSGPPPTRGTPAHASVVVDTTPPTLQARLPEAMQASCLFRTSALGNTPLLPLNCTLIEENLRDPSVRLFYRMAGDSTWIDGGALTLHKAEAVWSLPPGLTGRIEIRLVATDLAGNRTTDDLVIDLPGREPETPDAEAAVAPSVDLNEPPADAAAQMQTSQIKRFDHPRDPDAQRLAEAAARFSERGEFALAAARLRDALALAPGDTELRVSLGTVHCRAREWAEAERRFREALTADPDCAAALEGLALVSMGQNRHAEARDNLKRLLSLDESCARYWLHYGDVEHRLGSQQPARDAWRRVLQLQPDAELRAKAERRLDLFGA